MRKIRFVLLATTLIVSGVFCSPPEGGSISGSGKIVTREKDFKWFNSVKAGFGITQLDIVQGDEFRVITHIDANFIPYLQINKFGNTLSISLEESRMTVYVGEFRVEITMPELVELTLTDAIRSTITGFSKSEVFHGEMYSSCFLDGDIESDNVELSIFSHSEVTLNGSARTLTLRAHDDTVVDLSDFSVENARVKAEERSTVILNVSGHLDAEAVGSSIITYIGNPTLGDVQVDETSAVDRK